eukprot:m.956261 g.956261  ORF g.956261 m.956261 type:complete len:69 (-) comp23872_c0_seq42:3695-3901(-)
MSPWLSVEPATVAVSSAIVCSLFGKRSIQRHSQFKSRNTILISQELRSFVTVYKFSEDTVVVHHALNV